MDRHQDNNINHHAPVIRDEPSRTKRDNDEEYIGCMALQQEETKQRKSSSRRKRSKSADNKRNRLTASGSSSSASSAASSTSSSSQYQQLPPTISQVPTPQIRDEPSRSTTTAAHQILKFSSTKSSSLPVPSTAAGSGALKDIPNRIPPRKTRSGILPSSSSSAASKARRREIRQQIDESILQNIHHVGNCISLEASLAQSNDAMQSRQLTSSPTSSTSNSKKNSRRSKGSSSGSALPGLSPPPLDTTAFNMNDDVAVEDEEKKTKRRSSSNDSQTRGRDRRSKRTTSAVSTSSTHSTESTDSSVFVPSAASAAVNSNSNPTTRVESSSKKVRHRSKSRDAESTASGASRRHRSKSRDAESTASSSRHRSRSRDAESTASASSSKEKQLSGSTGGQQQARRGRRRDKGDSMPKKPKKAPPSPTEDDVADQTLQQTTQIASGTDDEEERRKDYYDGQDSRWKSDNAQPSDPSAASSSSSAKVKRHVDGKTVRTSAIKPKRVSSDPYLSTSAVWKGPPPPLHGDPTNCSNSTFPPSKLSDQKNSDEAETTAASRGRSKGIMKSINKVVRKISKSPGPHARRNKKEDEQQTTKTNPDAALPNPITYRFWSDDQTTSTASTKTMSTMSSRDISDQSTLASSEYKSTGSGGGRIIKVAMVNEDGSPCVGHDKIETADGEGIDHLLGRLRSNFDKPTDHVHHKPVHFDDQNKNPSPSELTTSSQLAARRNSLVDLNDEGGVSSSSSRSSRERRVQRSKSSSSSKKKRPTRNSSEPLISSTCGGKKRVVFGTVSVREYERCIGDNPAVSSGPPIGLGWYYLRPQPVDLEYYEAHVRKPGPRTRKDFFLTPQKRFHILLDEWGFSVQDICKAKDQASELRYQRQVSVFGDSVVPQLSSGRSSTAASPKSQESTSSNKKGQSYSSSKKSSSSSKLTKLPRSQDRWNTSCPAAPISQ